MTKWSRRVWADNNGGGNAVLFGDSLPDVASRSFRRRGEVGSMRTTIGSVRSAESLAGKRKGFQDRLCESLFQNSPHLGSFVFCKSQTRRSG